MWSGGPEPKSMNENNPPKADRVAKAKRRQSIPSQGTGGCKGLNPDSGPTWRAPARLLGSDQRSPTTGRYRSVGENPEAIL
ncbi:hypothetical protein J6590_002059 [Homalodisca vitripennis]|nr:hypothetical protein J6590_002059 [Homalodisca vitripennis]